MRGGGVSGKWCGLVESWNTNDIFLKITGPFLNQKVWRISPHTVQVFSVLLEHNSKTRTYDTIKFNYSHYVQNCSSTDFSSMFCRGFRVTFHNRCRLTEWDYKYSEEGIGRIFRISKYFLQVVHRYRAQSINAIWNQLPYFFHDMDDWFRDKKNPLILFAFCQLQKHWFLFQKRVVLNLRARERENGFIMWKLKLFKSLI